MRIGILGAGGISDTHARAARAIDGVAGRRRPRRESRQGEALAQAAGAAAFDDLDTFLAHPMDIVAIGSPSGVHADQAIAAARRGIHVLVEKPLDITTAKIDALIARSGSRRRESRRVLPGTPDARARRDEGGRSTRAPSATPVFISGHVKWYRPPEYYGASRWRGTWKLDGGGALMNQAHPHGRRAAVAVRPGEVA